MAAQDKIPAKFDMTFSKMPQKNELPTTESGILSDSLQDNVL